MQTSVNLLYGFLILEMISVFSNISLLKLTDSFLLSPGGASRELAQAKFTLTAPHGDGACSMHIEQGLQLLEYY